MFWNRKHITALEERIDRLERTISERCHSQVTDQIEELHNEINAVISRMVGEIENDPEKRMRFLLDRVAGQIEESISSALRQAEALSETVGNARKNADEIEELHAKLMATLTGARPGERRTIPLGEMQCAESTGYVSLWFDGGHPDRIDLLVGWSDPPIERVCSLNLIYQINRYASTVVRSGEYWIAKSKYPEISGVKCVFTPFI